MTFFSRAGASMRDKLPLAATDELWVVEHRIDVVLIRTGEATDGDRANTKHGGRQGGIYPALQL